MTFAVVIPAQDANKYHELGDLAPFGGVTLLEWKIAQCKEFSKASEIYICSDSKVIKEIAENEEVNFIERQSNISYKEIIVNALDNVKECIVLWTNPTSPFLGLEDYLLMKKKYESDENIKSLVGVCNKYDYIYYNNKRLNFLDKFIPRSELKPVQVVTNGCYIVDKKMAIKKESLYGNNSFLYELDYFSSIEIKDLHTYKISKELISVYFKRDLGV
jgi:CMP-N-acetylneuraminic acid synthetase